MNIVRLRTVIPMLAALGLLQGQAVLAQPDDAANDAANNAKGTVTTGSDTFASFRIAPTSALNQYSRYGNSGLFDTASALDARNPREHIVEDALDFNLGLEITPIKGLNIRADAWQREINEVPGNTAGEPQHGQPRLYIQDTAGNEFSIDNPFTPSSMESSGFDIGASYIWDTNRYGQFTLSTKTTYVQQFENSGTLLDLLDSERMEPSERVVSPELQSSMMLTWQFGNHTASAIANYFDSFQDISELDLDEINALVDNITTFDLQYGYSLETGNNDRAIISFGIRNIFNENTTRMLNSHTRILDQNGRVAYGSIKYQF